VQNLSTIHPVHHIPIVSAHVAWTVHYAVSDFPGYADNIVFLRRLPHFISRSLAVTSVLEVFLKVDVDTAGSGFPYNPWTFQTGISTVLSTHRLRHN
jgi:hypothetical protein